MDSERIVEFDTYKTTLDNKKNLDNGEIELDQLSLEEMQDVEKLYLSEVSFLQEENKQLKKENEELKAKSKELGIL